MTQFVNTEYFVYAWWLPFGLVLLWLYMRWRDEKVRSLADKKIVSLIFPAFNSRYFLWRGLLLLGASLMIILALANPIGKAKPVKGKTSGLDIVFALDVSKSMDAQDLKPSRLARATQLISNLSEKLGGNRMGLVVFAGNAYVQMPLTSDAPAMKLFLGNTNTDMISEQGTAIGDAIGAAKEVLLPEGGGDPATKIILLFTDGENHDGDAIQAAKEAGRKGLVIYTIGAGSEAGAPVPLLGQYGLQGYLKDANGETVISRLDPDMLREIASAAHGKFYRLGDKDGLETQIVKELQSIAKGEQTFEIYDANETRFQWFAAAALFLLLMEQFLNRYRNTKVV